ncbi:hypothetical protein D3C87_1518890 [compost metagenome]
MGGEVAVAIDGDGEEDVLVLQEGVLDGEEGLVGEGVEARAVLLGGEAGDLDVPVVEHVLDAQGLGLEAVLEQPGRDGGSLAREAPPLADEVILDGVGGVVDDQGRETTQQNRQGNHQRAGDLQGEARPDFS